MRMICGYNPASAVVNADRMESASCRRMTVNGLVKKSRSPTYWGNITAPLKAIFDRNVVTFEHFLNNAPKPKMKGKKAIIVVTSGSGFKDYKKKSQSSGTIQAIKTVLQSGGYEIAGVINMHSAWN